MIFSLPQECAIHNSFLAKPFRFEHYFIVSYFYPHTNFLNGNCSYAIQYTVDLFYIFSAALYYDLGDFHKGKTVKQYLNNTMILKDAHGKL